MSSLTLPPSALPDSAAFGRARRPRAGRLLLVAAAHAAAVWLFLQADVLHRAVQQATPLMVALLSAPAPPRPPEPQPLPQPPRPVLPAPALMPPPEVRVADTAPPAPPPAAVIAPVVPPAAPVLPAAPAPAEPAPLRAAPPPPAATAPPVLPASAIRYRVPPPVEVPLASRRLRESGTVLLRVLVDAQGLPRQITLHQSSGFARLDAQALAAMRQARFQVVSDNGQAIAWIVIAPLQYDVD